MNIAKTVKLVGLVALGSLASSALAVNPTTDSAAGKTVDTSVMVGEKKSGEKIICRREKTIGTRLSSKRTCLTSAEWARQNQTDREGLERIQTSHASQGN